MSGIVPAAPVEEVARTPARADTRERAWRPERVFAVLVASYAAVWLGIAFALGVRRPIDPRLLPIYFTAFPFLFLWYTAIAGLVHRIRRKRGLVGPIADARGRGLRAGITFLLAALFGAVFSSAKAALPELGSFSWDAPLALADRVMHGGVDPWVLLQPVLGYPIVTHAFAFLYSPVWFLVAGAFMGWIAWQRDGRVRLRFFVAYAFTWILLGNVLALAMLSAGPVYYGFVEAGPDPFVPLIEYLRSAAPGMAGAQQALWADLVAGGGVDKPSLGVSAAPSLHVAVPALFAMVAWRLNRTTAWLLWAFTALTLIGTVHLAWHYAVDGYLGILGAWAVLRGTDFGLAKLGAAPG